MQTLLLIGHGSAGFLFALVVSFSVRYMRRAISYILAVFIVEPAFEKLRTAVERTINLDS